MPKKNRSRHWASPKFKRPSSERPIWISPNKPAKLKIQHTNLYHTRLRIERERKENHSRRNGERGSDGTQCYRGSGGGGGGDRDSACGSDKRATQVGEEVDLLVRQPVQTQTRCGVGHLSPQGLHLRHRRRFLVVPF